MITFVIYTSIKSNIFMDKDLFNFSKLIWVLEETFAANTIKKHRNKGRKMHK